jgi:hypothetical protein
VAITDGRITFYDFQSALDPSGTRIMPTVEVLNQVNPALQDGPIMASNSDSGNRVTLRSGLPVVTTGKIDKGIPRSKSATEQRTDSMALFVGRKEMDVRQKKVFGPAAYANKRASEDLAYAESFSQYVTQQFLYGSINADEATFDGLSVRTPNLQQPSPGVGASQVWSQGTVTGGDGTSIFIVDWGERGVHWIYPMNDPENGGLDQKNYENEAVNDVDGNPFHADVTEYNWMIGISVEDPRRLARIANVDISDAGLFTGMTQGRLTDTLMRVMGRMPPKAGYNRVIYAPLSLVIAFTGQVSNLGAGVPITLQEYLGERDVPHFLGAPIRQLDQFSLSEAAVA